MGSDYFLHGDVGNISKVSEKDWIKGLDENGKVGGKRSRFADGLMCSLILFQCVEFTT